MNVIKKRDSIGRLVVLVCPDPEDELKYKVLEDIKNLVVGTLSRKCEKDRRCCIT